MQRFLEQNSALRRTASSVGLAEQLQATADAVVGGVPFAGLAWRVTGTLVSALRDRQRRGRLLAGCPLFARLVELDSPDEMLPFLPALLSWDLGRARQDQPTDVVLFLDTFERVDGPRDGPRDAEDALARFVFLMPNALVVVMGRNRLRWGDGRIPQIAFSGPDAWPALSAAPTAAAVEPMQRQLVGFGPDDARAYLRRRLVRDGAPAIPPRVVERIVAGSAGLPLYLSLASEYFDEVAATGAEPEARRFGGTFPQVVVRMVQDLGPVDRGLLRVAALAGRFDRELLLAGLAGARDADVDRFLARNLVHAEPAGWFRYALDDGLRDTVRQQDGHTDDAWSAREWAAAGQRLLDRLEVELSGDVQDTASADRSRLVQGFAVAVRISVECGIVPDWLYRAAYALRLLCLPSVLEGPAARPMRPDHPATPLLLTCLGMARRLQERRDSAVALFEQAERHPAMTGFGRLFVRHRLGKALEEIGRIAEAEPILAEVAAVDSADREVAEKDLARLQFLRGDPRRARAWAGRHRDSVLPIQRAQALDLLGWTHLLAGELAAAEAAFRRIVDDEPLARAGLSRDTALRHLALVVCWTRPAEGLRLAREAGRVNAITANLTGMAQAHTAAAISLVGGGARDEVRVEIEQATALLEQAGNRPELWFPLLATLFQEAVTGTVADAGLAATTLVGHLDRAGLHPGLRDVAAVWLDERGAALSLPERAAPPAGDLDLDAWREVLRRRRHPAPA